MKLALGIDIGGTNIVCGLVEVGSSRILAKVKEPTEAEQGHDHVIAKIWDMAQRACAQVGVDWRTLAAIGAGVPGFIDPERGVCLFAANLGFRNLELARLLRDKTNIPVFIDNDVRMYAYGEAAVGAGQGAECMLGVTLGTGIASALVYRGQLYYGGGFMAGEIGHIRMEGESAPCGCGMSGCLETVASATGIVRQAREALAQGRASLLSEAFGRYEASELSAAKVAEASSLGDPLAGEIMAHTGRLLGRGLSYAVTLQSPDVVVLGGGVALAGETLFAPMREELQRSLYSGYWERLSIRQGQLIDDGGVIGSAALAASKAALGE